MKKTTEVEWMANGRRLARVPDAKGRHAYMYRTGTGTPCLAGFDGVLSGGEVMPGFPPDLRQLVGERCAAE